MRKSVDTKTLPWEIGAFTENSLEIDPLRTTHSEQSKRKFLITFNRNPQTLYTWSFFFIRPRCHTLSKFLVTSNDNSLTLYPLLEVRSTFYARPLGNLILSVSGGIYIGDCLEGQINAGIDKMFYWRRFYIFCQHRSGD